jgi:uncharacterized protein (TIGR02246 family)
VSAPNIKRIEVGIPLTGGALSCLMNAAHSANGSQAGSQWGNFRAKETPMKSVIKWWLLASVLLMCAAWSQAQDSSATEQAVAAQEQKWMQGQKTNNPDLIAPLLADKIISTTSEGKVLMGKNAVMEVAKGTKYTQMQYEDVKVSVFGDTAIATGGGNSEGTDPSGKAFTNHERWTDTWVKMPDGQWQCVASQSTPLKK